MIWIKEPSRGRCHQFHTMEASTAGSDRKDTFGYLGNEDMTAKELLRCLAASLEQMA